ncbi:hypothetical protein [Persicitalea sp.]
MAVIYAANQDEQREEKRVKLLSGPDSLAKREAEILAAWRAR